MKFLCTDTNCRTDCLYLHETTEAMATKNTDRRDYLIIRRIMKNDYPNREEIMEYLEDNGCRKIDMRTFQRDLENIRSNYDLSINYDTKKRGYYIDTEETTRDLGDVMRFIELAETADILNAPQKGSLSAYLSFSPATTPKGTEHLRSLLSAAMNCFVVKFDHRKYDATESTRIVAEPYMLKEFDERWYLFAYVPARGAFRTFGLDRIDSLVVTAAGFERLREKVREAEKFNNVYGLVYMPDQNPDAPLETVRLRFAPFMVGHLSALPLHRSQIIDGNEVILEVIINTELQNKIMSYGEHVEVLAPESLRQGIRKRHEEALKRYL